MNKYFIVSILLLFGILPAFAQPLAYQKGDMEDLFNSAVNNHKLLLVKVPSKGRSDDAAFMEQHIMTEARNKRLLLDNFVMVEMPPKWKDDPFGLKKKVKPGEQTIYVMINPRKELVYKIQGVVSRKDFQDALLFAISPDNNRAVWEKMLKEDPENGNPSLIFNYAKALYLGGDDWQPYARRYFNLIAGDIQKDAHAVEAVLRFVDDMNDPLFKLMMSSQGLINWSQIDPKYFKYRSSEIMANSLIGSEISKDINQLEDSAGKVAEDYMVEDPMVLISLLKLKYYKDVQPDEQQYKRLLFEYLSAMMNNIPFVPHYYYLKEIVYDMNDEELDNLALMQINELISRENVPDYQFMLIDLSLKRKDYNGATHALQTLKRMQMEQVMVDNTRLQLYEQKVATAVADAKEEETQRRQKEKKEGRKGRR